MGTERKQLLKRGKVAYQFDELTINTARNSFLRAALEAIKKFIVLQSYEIRFATVDLSATAQAIWKQLLRVLNSSYQENVLIP